MSRHLPIYLHSLRKQWGLSQPELGQLFGIGATSLSKFETLARKPTINLLLGSEVIFGHPPRELFPKLYDEVEDKIMRRARSLYERFEGQTDKSALEKLRLLTEMIERADPSASDI